MLSLPTQTPVGSSDLKTKMASFAFDVFTFIFFYFTNFLLVIILLYIKQYLTPSIFAFISYLQWHLSTGTWRSLFSQKYYLIIYHVHISTICFSKTVTSTWLYAWNVCDSFYYAFGHSTSKFIIYLTKQCISFAIDKTLFFFLYCLLRDCDKLL